MPYTNELPLRHLITTMDGPTSSGTGFTGPVGRLLKKVNEMEYDPEFVALPGGEELIDIPDSVLVTMSTDQQMSYRLVKAVKSGVLPPELQQIQCGTISHARGLTTAQSLVYMWTRKHGLTGQDLTTLEVLAKYCIEMYFDIKIHHRLSDGPRHILTQLRILRSQPKEVRDAVTFYVRTGAWYAHSECVLLSLVSSESVDDRRFAVSQIQQLRGDRELGGTEVRPRITPQAESGVHHPAGADQLAARPGAGAGVHPDPSGDQDDRGEALRGPGVQHPHAEHRASCKAGDRGGSCSGGAASARWLHPGQGAPQGGNAFLQAEEGHHGHLLTML